MARVICTLRHASTLINGVSFTEDRGQMISDEVSDEVALNFAAIDGYHLVGDKPADTVPPIPIEPEGVTGSSAPPIEQSVTPAVMPIVPPGTPANVAPVAATPVPARTPAG